MKAIFIINPSSGKIKRELPPILRWTLKKLERRLSGLFKPKITEDDIIEEVKNKCDEEKIKLDIEFTKYPKHATKLAEAAKDEYDLIIAAGGGGKINEVINGMAESKATLVKLLFRYKWHKIYVKHKVESTGYFVIMANIKYYGGEYEIADKANIKDGLLDLVIINRKNPWDIIMLIFSFTSGKLNKFLKKEYYQTKEAEIYSHYNMQIQVDGEVLGMAPVRVE